MRRSSSLCLSLFCASVFAGAAMGEESFVDTYETAAWTVGMEEFDEDDLQHTTATVEYGADSGLTVYCSHGSVIALRVDPFIPNGPTPQSTIRFVVKSGDKTLYDQALGPFTFADNSYGGAIDKALAEAMKKGSRLEISDPTIGLDKAFPLKDSERALDSLACVR